MSFRDVVDRVIELGDAARSRLGGWFGAPEIDLSDPEWDRVSPEQLALRDYLRGLPDEAVYRLIALMYLGRRDFPASAFEARARAMRGVFPTVEVAVHQMVEKFPLPNYLRDGLSFLVRAGLDVEPVGSVATQPA